jgi:hypothetical protein
MDESVYTCSGPGGRAEVLACAVCRYYIYRWHNGGLYIEGAWTSLEDAVNCARAVTGCEPSGTAG